MTSDDDSGVTGYTPEETSVARRSFVGVGVGDEKNAPTYVSVGDPVLHESAIATFVGDRTGV